MSDAKFPGGTKNLLRVCSPVIGHGNFDGQRGIVVEAVAGSERILVVFAASHLDRAAQLAHLTRTDVDLDLTIQTGQAHAAWWALEHASRMQLFLGSRDDCIHRAAGGYPVDPRRLLDSCLWIARGGQGATESAQTSEPPIAGTWSDHGGRSGLCTDGEARAFVRYSRPQADSPEELQVTPKSAADEALHRYWSIL